MKKQFKLVMLALAALMTVTLVSCEKDDPENGPEGGQEEVEYYYDVVVSIAEHGGMNQGEGTVVRRVESLEAGQPMIDFNNKGVVLTGTYTMENIIKGKYYYQVPESADRFVKYEIIDDNTAPVVIASCPFVKNTFKQRSYTHAWIDDNTLLIMAANGAKDKIVWTKLNAETMAIVAEGELDLTFKAEKATVFSTSGILTYRKADNKLFYFYTEKESSRVAIPGLYTLVLDPATMGVLDNSYTKDLAEEMAGTAYGELLQNTVMYDEKGTLYLACLKTSDVAGDDGILLRINPGETEFDPSYNGYANPDGKLLTVQYLGNGKALIYSRNDRVPNPEKAGKYLTGISDYIHYYSILDLNTGIRTRLQYNGADLPYCAGRFAQRSVVANGKAYIGVTAQEYERPCIFIYDIAKGTMEKGVEISEGFYFDLLRVVEK